VNGGRNCDMADRLARFSVTFDCDPDATADLVLNAGSDKGFTLFAVHMNWQPEDLGGPSDVPHMSVTRYTSAASSGTAGVVFSHTDGDTSSASALIDPSTLGSSPVNGPQFWPGVASYTGSAWFLHGGMYVADFAGAGIYVASDHSLRVRASRFINVTAYFSESLTP
jgi:hypothetical protein